MKSPDPADGQPADDGLRGPRALAAALERAMAGREALVREVEASPGAPALRTALRLSDAHIERLLGSLASLAPPGRAAWPRRLAAPPALPA